MQIKCVNSKTKVSVKNKRTNMKKKNIIFSFCLSFLFSTIYCFGNDVADTSGALKLILGGIKNEKANIAAAETVLSTANLELGAREPDLIVQRDNKNAEAKKYFDEHNEKHEKGSPEYNYWQGLINAAAGEANTFQSQIDGLHKNVTDAQTQKERAEERLAELGQQLQDAINATKADCAKSLPAGASVEQIMNCWRCFFDGDCRDFPPLPRDPRKPFVAVPNGAPIIFSEPKNMGIDHINVPAPPVPPPAQKGIIEEATDKVRSYFRDIINRSQRIKNRVTAVLAVRG